MKTISSLVSQPFIIIFLIIIVSSCQNKKSNQNINSKDSIKNSKLITSSLTKQVNEDSVNFISFWKLFREAVLNSDTAQLINLTAFPIETRGPLDSDPTVKYSKKQFHKVFYYFLNHFNGINGKTEFDTIKETQIPYDEITENRIRIGDMVFFLIDRKWKLNFLYLNYDAIDSISKKNSGDNL